MVPIQQIGAKVRDWADFASANAPAVRPELWPRALFGLSLASGTGTFAVATNLTARPIVVAASFAGLALLTLGSLVTGVYLRARGAPQNDRQVAIRAGADIDTNRPGYDTIRARYGQLIDEGKINVALIQEMLLEDAQTLTFALFQRKHGQRLVFDFIDNKTKAILKPKYLAYVAEERIRLGTCNEIARSIEAVALNAAYAEIAPLVVYDEVRRATSFRQFLASCGKMALQYVVEADAKKTLRDLFLSMPYDESALEEFSQERAFFGIDEQALQCLHIEFLNGQAGSEGFRERFGNYLLQRKWVTDDAEAKMRTDLKAHLAGSLDQMDALSSQMQQLCLSRNEVLLFRWQKMTIQEIVAKDRQLFFDYALRLYSRLELVEKVLNETISIIQILALCPEIFTLKILRPEDGIEPTISERLEEEIRTRNTLDDIPNMEVIFGCALLAEKSVARAMLSLLKMELTRHQRRAQEIVRDFERGLQALQARQEDGERRAHEELDLDSLRARLSRARQVRDDAQNWQNRAEDALQEGQSSLQNQSSSIGRLSELRRALLSELEDLQSKVRTLERTWPQLQPDCERAKKRLEQISAEIARELPTKLASIEEKMRKNAQDRASIRQELERQNPLHLAQNRRVEELGNLCRQLVELNPEQLPQRIKSLEEEIEKEEKRRQMPVTGIMAAMHSLSSPLASLQRQLSTLREYAATAESTKEKLRGFDTLEKETMKLQAMQAEIGRHDQALVALQFSLSELVEEKDRVTSEVHARHHFAAVQREYRSLTERLQKAEEAKKRIAAIEQEQSRLDTALKEEREAMSRQRQSLDESQAQKRNADQAFGVAQSTFDALEQDLQTKQERLNATLRTIRASYETGVEKQKMARQEAEDEEKQLHEQNRRQIRSQ